MRIQTAAAQQIIAMEQPLLIILITEHVVHPVHKDACVKLEQKQDSLASQIIYLMLQNVDNV